MPIPAFVGGFLPKGCHACTWDELVERFGIGQRRQDLIDALKGFMEVARNCGFPAVAVGGSFPTEKESPGDLDMLFIHPRHLDRSKLSVGCAQLLVNDTAFHTRTGHNAQNCPDEPETLAYVVNQMGYDVKTGRDRGTIMVRF
jgi:hypothetical protein